MELCGFVRSYSDFSKRTYGKRYHLADPFTGFHLSRRDGIIDLCEMKFTDAPFAIDKKCYENLMSKLDAFRKETGTRKALHVALASANGVVRNAYSHAVQFVITADDLFRQVDSPFYSGC